MQLKNTSQKIIHVGKNMILPDETGDFPDDLAGTPAVALLIARKALTVVKSNAVKPAEKPKTETR